MPGCSGGRARQGHACKERARFPRCRRCPRQLSTHVFPSTHASAPSCPERILAELCVSGAACLRAESSASAFASAGPARSPSTGLPPAKLIGPDMRAILLAALALAPAILAAAQGSGGGRAAVGGTTLHGHPSSHQSRSCSRVAQQWHVRLAVSYFGLHPPMPPSIAAQARAPPPAGSGRCARRARRRPRLA